MTGELSPVPPVPPIPPAAGRPTPSSARRLALRRGVAWNSFAEVAQFVTSFGGMVVLARLMPPAEYGKAAAVTGVLVLVSAFNAAGMLAHTTQLPEGEHPDWSRHWHAGVRLQALQFLTVNLVALACWWLPAYRAIAPLLHVGSIGCLLSLPHLMAFHMLLRDFDFARLRLGVVAGTVLNTFVTVGLGLSGRGAIAIVIGSQVAALLPLSLMLVAGLRWRPDRWLSPLDWRAHRAPVRFWGQSVATGLIVAARGALEAAFLPRVFGFASLGLLGRAQALYTNTSGRVTNVLHNTIAPVLPRSTNDPVTYARQATLFVLVVLLVGVAGAGLVGIEGPELSRVLYGERWRAADPLIWPAALAGLGMAILHAAGLILQAVGRLRAVVALSVFQGLITAPLILLTLVGISLTEYAWLVAIAELIAAALALRLAARHLMAGWVETALMPPFVALALAGAVTVVARRAMAGESPAWVLVTTLPLYALVAVLVLRLRYPDALVAVLGRLRPGLWLLRAMKLPIALPLAER